MLPEEDSKLETPPENRVTFVFFFSHKETSIMVFVDSRGEAEG